MEKKQKNRLTKGFFGVILAERLKRGEHESGRRPIKSLKKEKVFLDKRFPLWYIKQAAPLRRGSGDVP